MGKDKLKGGKGLPDVQTFLMSKFCALHFAMCLNGVSKGACFVRFYISSYLRKLKLMSVPLSVPTAFDLPYHYTLFKRFVVSRGLEGCKAEIVANGKSLFNFLQDNGDMCPVHGLVLDETPEVWQNASHPALMNEHRDLSWLVAHDVLPVRAVMHARNLGRSPRCPREKCGEEETVGHVLWEWLDAQKVWSEAGSVLDLFRGQLPIHRQRVLYGSPKEDQEKLSKVQWGMLWVLIRCLCDAIWKARNCLVVKGVSLPAQAVLEMGLSQMESYVLKDALRLGRQEAKRRWRLEEWRRGDLWAAGVG